MKRTYWNISIEALTCVLHPKTWIRIYDAPGILSKECPNKVFEGYACELNAVKFCKICASKVHKVRPVNGDNNFSLEAELELTICTAFDEY